MARVNTLVTLEYDRNALENEIIINRKLKIPEPRNTWKGFNRSYIIEFKDFLDKVEKKRRSGK